MVKNTMNYKIRIGNYVYTKMCEYSSDLIRCGEVRTNFEGTEYVVWYA